ncbi:MAG: hypothetical protein HN742_02265 [Lentisphaerae bacterium]|mgnify:CR=1 FL=1|nr:hypothetical protein [Lentisphaerota bacterium]MBT4818406.1 hypothetical protein [Lentisphaerota bacterium]MBT5610684.1 hypothetical protein [Lentisphaerota bacterium]MBT7058040.1 hypothetical protein [Lentisphaerota bacterium]MBT7840662.1 hypothetical protein [Lentisphaerota bacterium]
MAGFSTSLFRARATALPHQCATPLQRLAMSAMVGLFHLMIVASVDDAGGFCGPRDALALPAVVFLVLFVLAAIAFSYVPGAGRGDRWRWLALLAAIVPFPLYILTGVTRPWAFVGGLGACLVSVRLFADSVGLSSEGEDHHLDGGSWRGCNPGASCGSVGLHASTLGTVALLLMVTGQGRLNTVWGAACAMAFVGGAAVVSFRHRVRTGRWGRVLALAEDGALAVAIAAAFRGEWQSVGLPCLALRQVLISVRAWLSGHGAEVVWAYLTERPGQLLVASFALAIGIGTVVLSLPVMSVDGLPLPAIDALFTATSATCVTGLVVVDTGTHFSSVGQLAILGMIQGGGLGIMTVSTFVALLLGWRIGLKEEFAVGEMIGEQRNRTALRLLRFIMAATILIECTGAVLLALAFRRSGTPILTSLYWGAFHSVSAFCNAGFALFSTSFVPFATSTLAMVTLSALIIFGGLGFGVLHAMACYVRRGAPVSPYVRLVLSVSALFCLGGMLLIWLLERNGCLCGLSGWDTLVNAWFQSVTTRTAGFNSVDLTTMGPGARAVFMALMFVGGASGSTAGGVKITTFAVLLLLLAARLRGQDDVTFSGRCVAARTVLNAAALVFLGGLVVLSGFLLLTVTQPLPSELLFFETVSAFGTVGLSLGITADLTPFGKAVIIVLMFVGRVGPLTLLVMMRPVHKSAIAYPTAHVMIG